MQTIVPAGIAFASGLIGVRYGIRRLRQEKRLDFRREQLEKFYAPLAGMREHVVHMARLRQRVSDAAGLQWSEIAQRHTGQLEWDHESEFEPFGAIIDYENKQLTEDILPTYRDMLALFRDQYHLMEESTRQFYGELFDFTELWDRWLAGSIPSSVMERVNHDGSFLDEIGRDAQHHIRTIRHELTGSSESSL